MKKNSSQFKDSVFCMLFNDPDKLRNLYNALTGASYTKETPVTINTLKNVFSLSLRNDISFTIGEKNIVLIEHQSTINPNMPIRLLLYIAALYEKIIPRTNLYTRKKLKIPWPEFYLFYNGIAPFPKKSLLKLSQSFEKGSGSTKPSLELLVNAYNINAGHNRKFLKKSRDLEEYARFVALVRERLAGLDNKDDREEEFRLAIKECIDHNILREFFEKYREEVMSSLLSITKEEFIKIRTDEAREEGRVEGRVEGRAEGRVEGRVEGRAEALKEAKGEIRLEIQREKLESARKMKDAGLPIGQIKIFTGLSSQVIKKL